MYTKYVNDMYQMVLKILTFLTQKVRKAIAKRHDNNICYIQIYHTRLFELIWCIQCRYYYEVSVNSTRAYK